MIQAEINDILIREVDTKNVMTKLLLSVGNGEQGRRSWNADVLKDVLK